jgi:hypothetical protein
MKRLLPIISIAVLLTSCVYKTPDGRGVAVTADGWQIAAGAQQDGSLDWARIVPPPGLQPDGGDYVMVSGIDHTGQWSIRVMSSAP